MAAKAAQLLYALVVDDQGTRWGERASAVQRQDAAALLDVSPGAPRRHWISRSRGYSKTDDLAAITVAVLLEQLQPGSEAIGCAGDRDQARLLIDRMRLIALRTPELAGALDVGAYSATTAGGVRFEALAADAASSWGRTPSWVVVDEICQMPETRGAKTLWESVTTAVVKTAGRLAVITTSGDPSHWSRAVYDHAVEDQSWRVSETHGPAPWLDQAELAAERRRLPESSYLRLFENVWAAGKDRLLDYGDIERCASLPAEPLEPVWGTRYAVGVDLALRNDRAVIAVAHREVDDQGSVVVVCDRLDVFEPQRGRDIDLELVEGRIRTLSGAYYQAPVFVDPWQAAQMSQRLRRQGVRVVEQTFSPGENSRRTLALLELVRGHRLRIPQDRELIAELAALRLRETSPGVYRYDHAAAGHDDRATALSLCVVPLLQYRGPLQVVAIPSPASPSFGFDSSNMQGATPWRKGHEDFMTRPL